MSDEAGICQRCERIRLLTHCCMAHMKEMCHECYRRSHFVEVCHPECTRCARDGLAPVLSGYTQTAREAQ